jgi:hypothetical protein
MTTLKGFICCAHEDAKMLHELLKQLRPFRDTYGIARPWFDTDIDAGRSWRPEIQNAIAAADYFLLLVSADFIDSDFIRDTELPAIEKRRKEVGAPVIPVILRQCGWQGLVGATQAVPTQGGSADPISKWPDPDEGYDRARDQITMALVNHFNLQPIVRDGSTPIQGIAQQTLGILWYRKGHKFVRDGQGAIADAATAGDPDLARVQQDLIRMARTFAAASAGINEPGWDRLGPELMRMANAMMVPPERVAEHIKNIYAAIQSVVWCATMDARLREHPDGAGYPLSPEKARELGWLAETASLWVRQYPSAAALDDDLLRSQGGAVPMDAARAFIAAAGKRGGISETDAAEVCDLIAVSAGGTAAPGKLSAHVGIGVLNLLYRAGGLAAKPGAPRRRCPGRGGKRFARRDAIPGKGTARASTGRNSGGV